LLKELPNLSPKKTKLVNYRSTPLNIASVCVIVVSICAAIFAGSHSENVFLIVYLVPVSLLGLVIDLVLQIFLKRYLWLVVVELILLLLVIALNSPLTN